MVADIVDVAVNLANGVPRRVSSFRQADLSTGTVSMDEIESRYYLRIQVEDKPGVLGRIATLLSAHGISVDSLLQRPLTEGAENVNIIILTHKAIEKNTRTAVQEIESLAEVSGNVTLLRIEDI